MASWTEENAIAVSRAVSLPFRSTDRSSPVEITTATTMRAAARVAQPALRSGPAREKDYTYELKLLNEALGRPTAGRGPALLDDADRKLLRRGLHLVMYSQDGVTIPPELADHVTELSRELDLD